MQPFTALLLALTLASSTIASPIADVAVIKQRGLGPGPVVIVPSWINPKTGTIWRIGSGQRVQWNSDNVPAEIKADNATSLSLGYVDTNGNIQVDFGKFHFSPCPHFTVKV
jgi:hypothetical protein